MSEFFADVKPITYHYYKPQQKVLGKTMEEHLRMAVCFWHTFCWHGNDIFGEGTFERPWLQAADSMQRAEERIQAGFEFIEKLGLKFFTFHDRDVAPEGKNLQESNAHLQKTAVSIAKQMDKTKIKLLWGTANLFSHKRYMAGAATNPNPEVFAYAVAQVKQVFDITHQLGGANYVLWGGREGYDTLLNTDLKREQDQYARFLSLLVDYKHKIGFKGALLIEPKPCEPTKHQYDYDSATVFAFLQKHGLEKEFKMNIEANHATLAGHSFAHEVAYAFANDIFGSIDANQGDPQLGWDTDQFPTNLNDTVQAMYLILKNGGFVTGGFNFDTKLRRQSIDLEDMFLAHASGIETLARALLSAAKLIEEKQLEDFVAKRYSNWKTGMGVEIMNKKMDFEKIATHALQENLNPQPVSGKQELLESIVNNYI
jgi:xylose isomerase